ncbi:MAG: 50S ribosomal protein L22 [Coriobacteriales bacterium]|jgi:large subunit ribosomal protein L22|nr:50S ribosomal protein L22 [Coriobacteriales bacterium]
MQAKAQVRHLRLAPRKARIVIDMIRGKEALRAREILQFSSRDAAEVVLNCLNSAIANAEQQSARVQDLYVKETYADEGPTLKRIRARAKGSAARINKRTCHITVVVATHEEA